MHSLSIARRHTRLHPRRVCLCCPIAQSGVRPTDSHLPGTGGAGRLGAGGAGVAGGGGGRRTGAAGMAGGLAAGGSSGTWPDGGRAGAGRLGDYSLHRAVRVSSSSLRWLLAAATAQGLSPQRELDNRAAAAPPRLAPPRLASP